MSGTSFRLAAYAVCIEEGRVLLVRSVAPDGDRTWTLPGGKVEHGEDPFDAVIRELTEETGLDGVVERILGVDSRVIAAHESHLETLLRRHFRQRATSRRSPSVASSSTEPL